MSASLDIAVRSRRGFVVVAVTGEIDISTVTRLREHLFQLADSGRPLIVDWSTSRSSTQPGSVHWSAPTAARPRTAGACMRSAPGRKPGSCSG